MPIAGVIFDLDGVLIHSAQAHYQSWRALVTEHGLEVTQERFMETFGRQNNDIIPLLWGRELDAETVDQLGEQKEALYRDIVRGRVPLADGAADLVRDCAGAGLKLAIGSSTHPANIDLVLTETALRGYFDATVSAADVKKGKPNPEVFEMACQRLGLPPQDCVVLEDAPAGIAAAVAAGCASVGVTTHHCREALCDADWVVDSLTEVSAEMLSKLR